MSDKHFIGKRLFSFSDNGLRDPVSRVTLLVDDNKAVTAGDDTGLELVANCPYADETLAQTLLNTARGYQYRAFDAQSADLDPAAELGDGITADGVYSILAGLTDKGDGYPDISAPGDREEEDEYPEGGPLTRLFNRQLATTRSLISKNSESVQILVERTDGVENEISYIQVDLEGITQRVEDAEGSIGVLELTATQLTAQIAGKIDGTEAQALIDLSLDNLTLSVSNGATSSKITLKAGESTIDSATIRFTGVVTFSALKDAPGADDTIINGGWIDTDTLFATNLMGEYIYLLDENEAEAGTIKITPASTAAAAVEIRSYGALRLVANDGAVYLESGDASLSIDYIRGNGDTVVAGADLAPNDNGTFDLGLYDYQWRNIYSSQTYAETAEADTSDRNKKNSIRYDLSKFDPFFDGLMPAIFKLNNGTSGRDHLGLIAQDVEDDLEANNIPTSDFAGFIKIEDSYALRYGEFIALLIWQVQMLKKRVATLEGVNV